MHINRIIGFQAFTSQAITNITALSSSLLIDGDGNRANAALFSVGGSSGSIRFRDDGTAPTTAVGHRISNGQIPFFYQGDVPRVRFIADAIAGNADFTVTTYSVADG